MTVRVPDGGRKLPASYHTKDLASHLAPVAQVATTRGTGPRIQQRSADKGGAEGLGKTYSIGLCEIPILILDDQMPGGVIRVIHRYDGQATAICFENYYSKSLPDRWQSEDRRGLHYTVNSRTRQKIMEKNIPFEVKVNRESLEPRSLRTLAYDSAAQPGAIFFQDGNCPEQHIDILVGK